MKQKPLDVPAPSQQQAPKPVEEKPLDSTDILNKLNNATKRQLTLKPNDLVWVCRSRIDDTGRVTLRCLRPAEGRPPSCPLYTIDEASPLMVGPCKVPFSQIGQEGAEQVGPDEAYPPDGAYGPAPYVRPEPGYKWQCNANGEASQVPE